jgi:uncharacterized protein HemX
MSGASGQIQGSSYQKTAPKTEEIFPRISTLEVLEKTARQPASWIFLAATIIAGASLFYAIYTAATIANRQEVILEHVRAAAEAVEHNQKLLDERTERFERIEAELKRLDEKVK